MKKIEDDLFSFHYWMYLFTKRDFKWPEANTLTGSKTLPCDSLISQTVLAAALRVCNITVLRAVLCHWTDDSCI